MQTEFLLAGFGGQGVMFAGQLLAYAGMADGLNVTWIPSYGPEMRGGTAHCTVVLSDKPIGSPVVKHPQVVLAFNNPSFQKYAADVAPGGLLVVNTSLVAGKCQRDDITVVEIPATQLAEEVGETRLTNVVLLGAALGLHPVVRLETLETVLAEHLSAKKQHLLHANYAAIERGLGFVQPLTA